MSQVSIQHSSSVHQQIRGGAGGAGGTSLTSVLSPYTQSAQMITPSGQKIMPNNCRNDFEYFLRQYCWQAGDKGDVYTWGSGEMGQLGYSGKVIQVMPKDREGYPFQVCFYCPYLRIAEPIGD